MATGTSRWVTRNHAAQTTCIIKSSPACDPNRPASNVIVPSRMVVASVLGAAGADSKWYFDVGTGRTTHLVGVQGITQGGTLPNVVTIRAGNTYPEDGTWQAIATNLPLTSKRDAGLVLGAPVTWRYWGLTFPTNFSGYSFAYPLIAQIGVDLGIAFSAGTGHKFQRTRVRNKRPLGSDSISETGLPTWRLRYVLNAVTQAVHDQLFSVAAGVLPTAHVDAYGRLWDVDLSEDDIDDEVVWGAPDLYNVTLNMETLA